MIKLKQKFEVSDLPLKISTYVFISIVTLVSLFPFYFMFVCSTLSNNEILGENIRLMFGWQMLNNFAKLAQRLDIVKVIWNSVVTSLWYTVLSLLFHAMAGYAFAKFNFKGRNLLFMLILSTLIIPFQVLVIPLFKMMNNIGWQNTYKAVVFPMLANAFGIFLMRQNMFSFPSSLIESARIDGCNEFSILFKIVLPNMKPALGALGIYNFIGQWSSFMWPMIILSTKDKYTLPVALASLEGLGRLDFGMMMLGSTIAIVPIMVIFLIFQRQFISGMLRGSVKE